MTASSEYEQEKGPKFQKKWLRKEKETGPSSTVSGAHASAWEQQDILHVPLVSLSLSFLRFHPSINIILFFFSPIRKKKSKLYYFIIIHNKFISINILILFIDIKIYINDELLCPRKHQDIITSLIWYTCVLLICHLLTLAVTDQWHLLMSYPLRQLYFNIFLDIVVLKFILIKINKLFKIYYLIKITYGIINLKRRRRRICLLQFYDIMYPS